MNKHAESTKNILSYFFPELITAFILFSAINLIDLYFIAQLQLTSSYTTSGITNTLFHFINIFHKNPSFWGRLWILILLY